MGFKDKDGDPLLRWKTPEEIFEAWKECTRGRPCDYTGMNYAKLSAGSGIQWPCNEQFPDGAVHIYTDGKFNTDIDYCESYRHDLITGAAKTQEENKASDPKGKAFLKGAEYVQPYDDYPLWLTTGRLVYHFHTRTKTGRSKALYDAAPDSYVQI